MHVCVCVCWYWLGLSHCYVFTDWNILAGIPVLHIRVYSCFCTGWTFLTGVFCADWTILGGILALNGLFLLVYLLFLLVKIVLALTGLFLLVCLY